MSNNKNPYDLDRDQVRNKGYQQDVVRAEVLDVLTESHAVRVQPRGEAIPIIAPVLTLTQGSHTLPKKGQRVVLLYVTENTPVALGGMYLGDGVKPPEVGRGDLRLGNSSGSHLTIENGGDVNLEPSEGSTVSFGTNIEGCGTYMSANQVIPTDNQFYRLNFDTSRYDPTGIHDPENHEVVVQEDGLYNLTALAKMEQAGTNTNVEIAISVNGTQVVSQDRDAPPSGPISPTCQATRSLTEGDVIHVEFRIASGSADTLLGGDEDTEFDVTRLGSLGPTNVQSGAYTDESAQDAVAEALVGTGATTISYDDENDTITIDTSGVDNEEVQDIVADLLTAGTGVSLDYDDPNDTLTISGFSGSHNDLTDVASDDHHTRYSDSEAVNATADEYVNESGDTMSGSLNMGGNGLDAVENTTFANSSNDFWRINDASGGTNTSPHTARFDDRDLRYYAGTGAGTVWRLNQDGSVEYPVGPVTMGGGLDVTGNPIDGVQHIDGSNGNHRIRFDSNPSWLEFTDQSNNRSEIVTEDVYINQLGEWLGDGHVSGFDADMVDGYDIQVNGTDGSGIINFKT